MIRQCVMIGALLSALKGCVDAAKGRTMAMQLPNDALRVVDNGERVEVWLNRPAAKNAIDLATVDALHVVFDAVEREPRFVILTGGADGVFASGADLRDLRDRRAPEALRAPTARAYERLAQVPLPTVAAIDGYALGGGLELAMACDFRIASRRASFGQPEVRLGVLAGGGGTWRLAQLVGTSIARQMLMLGRRLDADEALERGLVDQVVDDPAELMPAAHAMVDKMAKAAPLALRLTKLALSIPASAHPTFDYTAQGLLFEHGEHVSRIDAFLGDQSGPRQR
jgi:enoyl-CoA hydratase/carnithine racemase